MRVAVSGVIVLAVAALPACASKENTAPKPAPSAEAPVTETSAAPVASVAPAAPDKPKDDGPRLYVKSRFAWVHPQPGSEGWIGYLWSGASVKLKQAEPVVGPGCSKWVAIEPRGYVCADGERATLDPKDPAYQVLAKYAPRLDTAWPHDYGESRGLIRYKTIPSPEEQRRREWDLVDHMKEVQAALEGKPRDASLEGVDLTPAPSTPIELGELPGTAREPRNRLLPTSTVAWIAQTHAEGRDWLLSADMMWAPKDRVMVYPKVTFHGVELGKGVQLPLAFFRGEDRDKFERKADGSFVPAGDKFLRLSYVQLTGKSEDKDGETYLETRDGGRWVKKKEAVVPEPSSTTPWGAPVGGADTKDAPAGRRTWIEASVWKGWLVAFEGTKPVYATMISPGRGGTPVRGKTPLETASTPTGSFKITGKFATATMVAPHEYIHSDVPWTQNFSGPHALHGAYWHDNWGNRMSAGCVNVSPIDGKWLFEFTEPELPPGWHGVRWRPSEEPATTFIVHD